MEPMSNWMTDLDFSPPEGLTVSLWRSLLLNLIDRVSPERLPPLQLTSKPVEVGISAGDLVALPWYRTIFSNLADVISPEILPPLQLESTPVDVGELVGDDLAHGWWHSLMGGLRDRLSPERLPALELTSRPVAAFGADASLQILDWSSLLTTPKVFLKDVPRESDGVATLQEVVPAPEAAEAVAPSPLLLAVRMQLARDLGRTRFRRRIWIGLAAAEAICLLVVLFKFQ
jgi:hypothetical protein